jgi:hypothetical protein
VGFEPTLPVKVNTLSKRAPSATRPSLRYEDEGARLGALVDCNCPLRNAATEDLLEPGRPLANHSECILERQAGAPQSAFFKQAPNQRDAVRNASRW